MNRLRSTKERSLQRGEIINLILNDLKSLKTSGFENQYAVEENIVFFHAIRSSFSYIKWLITKAPKLKRDKLLELTDLPFERWDREMHTKLVELEKREFPGLVKPLVKKIIEFILKENRPLVLVSLGCGGMEVERQVLKALIDKKYENQTIIIGIDKSSVAHQIAKENLKELYSYIYIYEIEHLDRQKLKEMAQNKSSPYVIVMCKNDIFELHKDFEAKSFDLIYHSMFKHHLTGEQKQNLNLIIDGLADKIFEYDGYRSWLHLIPQTITAWKYPQLLNGSVFSNFRYQTKDEIIKKKNIRVRFYGIIGTYLKENI